ncbi:MAG: hypothetical protein K0S45_548 [Nitrospira sp.]|jgi:hypothetical protein|nr:hypothetical protein [Nitrospira sp.]
MHRQISCLRCWWLSCFVAFSLLLSGCALTFGYRHADWLIRWQLDHYLDLNTGQRRDVIPRVKSILQRHRMEALPQYEQFLKDVQQRVSRGLTREDLDWIYASYERFRADLFERAAPDGGVLLTTVTDKQIRSFEKVLRKEEEKAARRLQRPTATRLEERAKIILALAEDWIGPLSAEQTARIRDWSLSLPDTQPAWWQYRQQRHRELLALLHHHGPPDEVSQALRVMFVFPERSAPRSYLDKVKDLREGLTTMVLGIDQLATFKQRRKAVATVQKMIDDIHGLQTG